MKISGKPLITYVLCLVLSWASHPCRANDPLLDRLRWSDSRVIQGEVVYDVQQWQRLDRDLAAQAMERQVQQVRDEGRRTNKSETEIEKAVQRIQKNAADSETLASMAYRVSLAYTTDGKFRREMAYHDARSGQTVVNVVDGTNDVIIDSEKVHITPARSQPTAVSKLVALIPGPCLLLGRGLSSLQDVSTQRAGDRINLSGKATDGSLIRAILIPSRGYVPLKIERFENGKTLIGTWDFSVPQKAPGGVWLPSGVTYRAFMSDGTHALTHRYRLVSADFRQPPASLFEVELPPDKLILDDRLAVPVSLEKRPASVHTLSDLLKYSHQRIERQQRDSETFAEERQRRNRVRRGLVGLLLLGLVASGWTLWTAMKAPPVAKDGKKSSVFKAGKSRRT